MPFLLLLLLLGRQPQVANGGNKRSHSKSKSKRAASSGVTESEAAGCANVQFLLGAVSCEQFLDEVSPVTRPSRPGCASDALRCIIICSTGRPNHCSHGRPQ